VHTNPLPAAKIHVLNNGQRKRGRSLVVPSLQATGCEAGGYLGDEGSSGDEDTLAPQPAKRVCAVVSSDPLTDDSSSFEGASDDSGSDSDNLERLLFGDDGLALLCDFDCGPI